MRPSPAPLFRIPNFPSPFPRAHYRLCRDYIRQALSPRRLTIHAHMKTTGAAPRQRGITQVLHFLRSASPPRRVGTVRFLREGKMTAPSSVTQRSFPVLRWEGKTKKPHTLFSASRLFLQRGKIMTEALISASGHISLRRKGKTTEPTAEPAFPAWEGRRTLRDISSGQKNSIPRAGRKTYTA